MEKFHVNSYIFLLEKVLENSNDQNLKNSSIDLLKNVIGDFGDRTFVKELKDRINQK